MPVDGIVFGNPLAILLSAATTEWRFTRFLIFEAVANSLVINCCNLLTTVNGDIIVIHEVFETSLIEGNVNRDIVYINVSYTFQMDFQI